MGVATLIAPFAQVSGKCSGAVSLSSSSGAVVCMPQKNGQTNFRAMAVPNQPNSTAQLQARANMTSVAEAFQSLTIEQVQDWKDLAAQIILSNRFGIDYSPSWNVIFSQINNYRLQAGLAIVTDAPAFGVTPLLNVTQVLSDDGSPAQVLTSNVEFLVAGDAVAGLPIRMRFTRATESPVYQIPANELRMVAALQTGNWGVSTATATFEIEVTSTRINILATDRIGVEMMVFTPEYVPSQRVFLRNTLVSA